MFKLVKIENQVKVLPVSVAAGRPEGIEAASGAGAEPAQDKNIEQKIYIVRGHRVMLDEDIAGLYGVEVKRLNEQVKRNRIRFPDDYMFQLTEAEYNSLRSQIAALKRGEHRKYLPYVFTEYGVVMLSGVLNSYRALEMSFAVVEAFIKIRKLAEAGKETLSKLTEQEIRLLLQDKKLEQRGNGISAILGHIVLPEKKDKEEKKYGFGTDENGNIIEDRQYVAVYGQQH
jgi:aromatic ring-opening dioxygenase LigB subunit